MEKNLIDHYKPRLFMHGDVPIMYIFKNEDGA